MPFNFQRLIITSYAQLEQSQLFWPLADFYPRTLSLLIATLPISRRFTPILGMHLGECSNIRTFHPQGKGFHTFRRFWAILAFDNNVDLHNIMAHGLWKNLPVWRYLQNASQTPSIIPSTFLCIISQSF